MPLLRGHDHLAAPRTPHALLGLSHSLGGMIARLVAFCKRDRPEASACQRLQERWFTKSLNSHVIGQVLLALGGVLWYNSVCGAVHLGINGL